MIIDSYKYDVSKTLSPQVDFAAVFECKIFDMQLFC